MTRHGLIPIPITIDAHHFNLYSADRSRRPLVQILLKSCKCVLDLVCRSQIRDRVRDRVVVLQLQQWSQLVLIEFINTFLHVLSQDE